eukprot:gene6444-7174_t
MKSSRGFSILCDKATDLTMNKTFCVNVRYVNDKCEPTTKLYRLLPVGKEGGADALFALLATTFAEDGIEWNDVIGYASDGENLMQGRNNSLLTQMKAAVPDLYVLKCYCHSFHLVAGHACETLSNTAEQLTHDIYNYFKNSPNRKKSFEKFEHFYDCEPYKILKPCQTRWLSLSQCVTRIISQWQALEYFFAAEADDFKLHRFLPEIERVIRMYCNKFMKRIKGDLTKINVDDKDSWLPFDKIYPGILAQETVKTMVPHERESFLTGCRNWYREAVHQILNRIDITDLVLKAVQSIHPATIVDRKAATDAAGVLALKLPRLSQANFQVIDREWRSLLIDFSIINEEWKDSSIIEFWKFLSKVEAYKALGEFMIQITALPQSTACVERTFSKVNNNKTKLRNKLAISTTEGIVKVGEHFPTNFKVDNRLASLHKSARSSYERRYSANERATVTSLSLV